MMKQSSSEAMLSSSAVDKSHSSISSEKPLSSSRDGSGGAQEIMAVDRPGEYTAKCRWTVESFPCLKAKALWSKYFDVGGYDCRLLVYPKGDSQAFPGCISIYLQIIDPRGTTSSLWDCFASYRLSIVNHVDDSLTIHKESWHRFSSKKRSHGWCDFTLNSSILDPNIGFLFNNDSLLITADILILNESLSFSIDNNNELNSVAGPMPDVLSGNFTWRVNNFSLFKEMMKSQKITSPVFVAGECYLRIAVYQSVVNEQEYLSMCLDSKDTEKSTVVSDKSSWCLFNMSALNQKPGCTHMNRESFGRFAADNKSGDNTSVGWNDYMKMSDFVNPEAGFFVDDTAVFSTSFHVIKEFSSFTRTGGLIGGRNGTRNGQMGKFTWTIENFTRLVDLLEKRKITGLYIKSKRFQIGYRDCRLIVYPRGQSKPPNHLSVFLEVTDSRSSTSDWSCFVSQQLSVVNQRSEEMSVTKESQNRYSKAEKDWGWREFVTLTSLFDQDSGFLVQDSVVFSAEVLILKETFLTKDYTEAESANSVSQIDNTMKTSFTWRVENFLAFKEIIEKRKIFSKFFQAGGCELRIGVYEMFDTICIYLESDESAGTDVDNNFWVKYKMGILNQKNPSKSVWKESSICTKTWNKSVLQFMKVSDVMEADAGFIVRDTVVFECAILDSCPWFEFSDLKVLALDDDQADALTTNPNEIIDSEESEEDTFQDFLSRAGFSLALGENPSQQLVILQEKFLTDAGAISGLLTDLRVYLDDPTKVKRLLLPTEASCNDRSKLTKSDESSPSLTNLLMGVKLLQQGIIDLLLDKMVGYCQSLKKGSHSDGCLAATSSKKWLEKSEEILGLIVNSLKTIDAVVPQGCAEFRRRPHSAQKIGLVLDRAPKHLLQDLVSLVPKLVEHSEHSLAAYALIQRLQKPQAEISLREPVYNALSQLECDNEVWEHILLQSYEFLSDSNEDSLVATIHFILKIASQCQQLPEAVRSVRERLKSLGADIAEMIRRDINSDFLVGL